MTRRRATHAEVDFYKSRVYELATRLDAASARAEAAEAEMAQKTTALNLIDAARAKAVAEIEALHQYLDECYINNRDEGRAVPMIDRVVTLVSRWAKADGEAERLRAQLAELSAQHMALVEKTGDW